VKERKKN